MKRAYWIVLVIVAVLAIGSWRYAFDMGLHGYRDASQLGALGGIALTVGLLLLILVPLVRGSRVSSGSWLPLRVLGVWTAQLRKWVETKERDQGRS